MARVDTPDLQSDPDRRAVQQFLTAQRAVGCARLSAVSLEPTTVLLAATSDSAIIGFAQATAANGGYVIDGVAVDAATRDLVVESLIGMLPVNAGLSWWGHEHATDFALADRLGMHAPRRRLLNMRRSLPLEPSITAGVDDVTVRRFEVGRDEQEWLNVNNAAFSWHGEQGDWDLATLQARMSESWFDPGGFLLYEVEGRYAAFCWTKVHAAGVGEIFVIAVHPDFHGHGLGRAMTVAGLRHLADTGSTAAMLYVEADNTSAVRLYESLGFHTAHTDVAFHRLPGRQSNGDTQ